MARISDAMIAHERKRWLRPNAHLWVRPDAERWFPPEVWREIFPEKRPRMEEREDLSHERHSAEAQAEYAAAFREAMLELRVELAWMRLAESFAHLAAKAGFNPDQPRIPAGQSGGGQWTSGATPGARYAQNRTRGSIPVRIGGRIVEVEGGQAARLLEAQRRAESAIARVREIDPAWKPTPSTYESVEGLISTYQAETIEAQARSAELARYGIGPGSFAGESIPARGPERDFTAIERDEINRIGAETGCHTCGATEAGTPRGNFVCDHQPPSALNSSGLPQRLYPQCILCSLRQGGWIRGRKWGTSE